MGWGATASLIGKLTDLPRGGKQLLMLACDFALLLLAAWGAFALRLGLERPLSAAQWGLIAAAPVLALPAFVRLGLYRSVIRYMGEQALWAIVKAMAAAALLWAVLAFMLQATGVMGMPRSVPLFYALLGLPLVAAARFAARWLLWLPVRAQYQGRQVLIYGAGRAGRQLAASLRAGRDMFPAGFLDDEVSLQGQDVDGLRVYAPQRLPELMERYGIHDVIVTMPGVSHLRRRQVVQFLEGHGVRVRILPAVTDLASGRHLVSMVREVDIGDLLGRDPVPADPTLLAQCVAGKVVLVSGAGGSIGSELCRQLVTLAPRKLVLLERSEHALYQIERELARRSAAPLVACLGSVTDAPLVARLLAEHGVQTIYHAAACKHVPLVEANEVEGAANNVLGTQVLGQAALQAGVETFVLISTDKAVRPSSVMGATKRWAEWLMLRWAQQARQLGRGQRFCAVRFGNVLGSSGSVIPLFKEQIAQGGPVTVTHPEMTRYFMSIHEAVELVIQAGSLAQGGEIFLLDMGEPVRIMDLARNMVRLAGLQLRDGDHPDGDIEIAIVGMRPGEKLHEELMHDWAQAGETAHPKIRRVREAAGVPADLHELLRQLQAAVAAYDAQAVRLCLMDAVRSEESNGVVVRLVGTGELHTDAMPHQPGQAPPAQRQLGSHAP